MTLKGETRLSRKHELNVSQLGTTLVVMHDCRVCQEQRDGSYEHERPLAHFALVDGCLL
jgi:hypothetical protein